MVFNYLCGRTVLLVDGKVVQVKVDSEAGHKDKAAHQHTHVHLSLPGHGPLQHSG